MCIAVYKPQGQKMPSKKIFSNCFSNNDDGAGFMFPLNGKVHYEKGFMSFTAFKKGLKDAIKKYGISTLDTPMVFHFRITSQGGVKPELTHPFPVCKSFDEMRKLKGDSDFAVVHNGIIDMCSSYSKVINYNDTMEFTKEVLCPLISKNANYYKNKNTMSVIDYLLSGNRFAIMDGKGHVELLGSWDKDGGIYYSNTSYKSKKSSVLCALGVGSGWKTTRQVPYSCPWEQDYEDVHTTKSDYWFDQYISKKQEEEFLKEGVLKCECGEEMVIVYDSKRDLTVAYCYECGLEYRLTPKAEDFAWARGYVIWDGDIYDDEVSDYNRGFGVAYGGAK